MEYDIPTTPPTEPITLLIYPIYTFVSNISSSTKKRESEEDLKAMRSIVEVCFPLLLPYIFYPSDVTSTFYTRNLGNKFVDQFPLHKLIVSLFFLLFIHFISFISSPFISFHFISFYFILVYYLTLIIHAWWYSVNNIPCSHPPSVLNFFPLSSLSLTPSLSETSLWHHQLFN